MSLSKSTLLIASLLTGTQAWAQNQQDTTSVENDKTIPRGNAYSFFSQSTFATTLKTGKGTAFYVCQTPTGCVVATHINKSLSESMAQAKAYNGLDESHVVGVIEKVSTSAANGLDATTYASAAKYAANHPKCKQ